MQTIIEADYTRPAGVAPAPDLGLTIIADGFHLPFLLDSQGVKYKCGIDKPTIAPIQNTTGGNPVSTYCSYVYCYAIRNLPKVEHTNSAGGLIYPRSNPSPHSIPNRGGMGAVLSIPPSVDPQVTDIFIYRTAAFTDNDEAISAAEAGLLYYVGKMDNVGSANLSFTDGADATSIEQASYDNFTAPMFTNVIYSEPYFYAGGFYKFESDIVVDYSGDISSTTSKFREGLNGKVATLDGISSGGFDGKGRFYFKVINLTTGKLYLDSALTIASPSPSSGSTRITIDGFSNILYRSAPRNPLSWGETEFIGDAIIPKQTGIRVGGGRIVSIADIGSSSTLKVDTIEPSKTFIFNLRATSVEDFTLTRKPINSPFTVDTYQAQVEIPSSEGLQSIVGFDSSSGVFFTTDGLSTSALYPDISKVIDKMVLNSDRANAHVCYDPNNKTVIFFVKTTTFANFANLYNAYCLHIPSMQWSRFLAPDVNCTLRIYDKIAGRYRTLVGSSLGRIGSLDDLSLGEYNTWWVNQTYLTKTIDELMPMEGSTLVFNSNQANQASLAFGSTLTEPDFQSMVGIWAYITTGRDVNVVSNIYDMVRYVARISSVQLVSGKYNFAFDAIYDLVRNRALSTFQPLYNSNHTSFAILVGASYNRISKTYVDTSLRKLGGAVVWKTDYTFGGLVSGGGSFVIRSLKNKANFEFWLNEEIYGCPDFPHLVTTSTLLKDVSQQTDTYRFYVEDPLPVDITTAFTVSYKSVGYIREQVSKMSLRFTRNGSASNNS